MKMAFIKEILVVMLIIAVSGIHQSEGVPVAGPLIKAKLEVAGDVGGKMKSAVVKKWESVKATGGAIVSVITAPFQILYKSVAIKFDALRTFLGYKGTALKKIVEHAQEKLVITTTTTTSPPLKELHNLVPEVLSNLHKNHFALR